MKQNLNPTVAKVLERLHYPLDVILLCVRWYVAYPLSLRHLEQMMAERGISVDHSTVHRRALKLLPVLEKAFRRCKRAVGRSWRMDETYIRVRGEWKYLYRAVDKAGNTIDFLLRAHRDKVAARRYFDKARWVSLSGLLATSPASLAFTSSASALASRRTVLNTDTPARVLLGFSNDDRQMVRNLLLAHIAQ